MPTPSQISPVEHGLELIWLGHGAWVARDPSLREDDPHCVVAYVEHKHHRVHVPWVRDRHGIEPFDTLRDAVHELAAACGGAQTNGGSR